MLTLWQYRYDVVVVVFVVVVVPKSRVDMIVGREGTVSKGRLLYG